MFLSSKLQSLHFGSGMYFLVPEMSNLGMWKYHVPTISKSNPTKSNKNFTRLPDDRIFKLKSSELKVKEEERSWSIKNPFPVVVTKREASLRAPIVSLCARVNDGEQLFSLKSSGKLRYWYIVLFPLYSQHRRLFWSKYRKMPAFISTFINSCSSPLILTWLVLFKGMSLFCDYMNFCFPCRSNTNDKK